MDKIDDKDVDDFLAHYGILGMKWGVRRTQEQLDRNAGRVSRNSRNPNYTNNQRRRDRQVYGRRGEKRINRALNRGDSISIARGDEKTKRDHVMSKNKYVRQGGKVAGAVAGAGIGFFGVKALAKLANTELARRFVEDVIMGRGSRSGPLKATLAYLRVREGIDAIANNPAIMASITAGAAYTAQLMSGDIAVNTRMRMHGYDPNRR